MHTITVELNEKSYPIYIGHNLLDHVELLQKHIEGQQVMIISNPTVAKFYLNLLLTAFDNYQCDHRLLPDGEQYKNLTTWSTIFNQLLTHKHRRSTTLIALGGGVIGDMTGFAAACYQRGVNFIQVPTTLLAQVDASIGGKTAVNHPLGKNMIGAFHQPNAVIIDTNTLKTLPSREYNAGFAEILKAALLADFSFFSWIKTNIDGILLQTPHAVTHAIESACKIKAHIVAEDEKEQGKRALLNLGHTFGHAVERCLGYQQWLHGEAVALGLLIAASLSVNRGFISENELNLLTNLIKKAKLPTWLPDTISVDDMVTAMQVDKKMTDKGMRLILLKKIGEAIIVDDILEKEIRQVLANYVT